MSHFKDYKFFRSLSTRAERWPMRKAEQFWRKLRERKIAGISKGLLAKLSAGKDWDLGYTGWHGSVPKLKLSYVCLGKSRMPCENG
ncbi:hypothetical protein FOCC_FOCC003316 [Frankliniella occidentalis]|nr:hypothetical protein FOCC_FOCC003316 [Frankliniella occidentalis]